jgi:hypothetical protein
MMMFAVGTVWAQDNATPPSDSQAPQQPVPAYGQEDAPPPISENPPLSGLDLPSLQEHVAPLSYLQPGATVSESADTNTGNTLGGSKFGSISRALGTLVLRRLWSNYDLALDYMGGVGYYNLGGVGLRQLQQLGLEQKIHWKRGQISFRDSFSYLPEGNFGGGYGSLGSVGIGGLGSSGLSAFQGGSGFGTFGLTPQILNVSLAEVSENLNPKSAVTATGGYAFTHFHWKFASLRPGRVQPDTDSPYSDRCCLRISGIRFQRCWCGVSHARRAGDVRTPYLRQAGLDAGSGPSVGADQHAKPSLQRSHSSASVLRGIR